jgi:hypothetical protein
MKKLSITLALSLAVATGAQAQAWPSKPVTLLVPFPPGVGCRASDSPRLGPRHPGRPQPLVG